MLHNKSMFVKSPELWQRDKPALAAVNDIPSCMESGTFRLQNVKHFTSAKT